APGLCGGPPKGAGGRGPVRARAPAAAARSGWELPAPAGRGRPARPVDRGAPELLLGPARLDLGPARPQRPRRGGPAAPRRLTLERSIPSGPGWSPPPCSPWPWPWACWSSRCSVPTVSVSSGPPWPSTRSRSRCWLRRCAGPIAAPPAAVLLRGVADGRGGPRGRPLERVAAVPEDAAEQVGRVVERP